MMPLPKAAVPVAGCRRAGFTFFPITIGLLVKIAFFPG